MPLFQQYSDLSCRWAIWRIDESLDELLAQLPGRAEFEPSLAACGSVRRRLERTAVRVLLSRLLGGPVSVVYRSDGKPLLENHPETDLSISHTDGYAAVILGTPGLRVGIDIERYATRIRRLRSRIVSDSEQIVSWQGDDTWSLLLHWSAKEVLFKCMGQREVDFLEHLHICPFHPDSKGCFSAWETRTGQNLHYDICYRLHPDYVLTWYAGL